MNKPQSSLVKLIQKCDICTNGNIISKESLLRALISFLDKTVNNRTHNVGIVLHTGSHCYDVIMLTYVALYNLLCSKHNPFDTVHSLCPGDLVLYYRGKKPQKYFFGGFVDSPDSSTASDENYIVLNQESSSRTLVPRKFWSCIIPYYGKSQKLGGIGLRKENENIEHFFTTILEMAPEDIPRTPDTSTVVVIQRDRANEIINGISFLFNGISIRLTDIIPVSYYTESNQIYQYGQNLAKSEPVLKLTGKMSVARKLVLQRSTNKNLGLVILGDETMRRGESELPELLDRQSLQYAYVCAHIDSESAPILVKNYTDAYVFACTKDFLLSKYSHSTGNNPSVNELNNQIAAVINRDLIKTTLDDFISVDSYRLFKQALFFVKTSDYDTDEKTEFLVQAYSLMNLFLTAPFSIGSFDVAITKGIVKNIATVEQRLNNLRLLSADFPSYLQESIHTIITSLENTFIELYENSPKASALIQELIKYSEQKFAIVTPKAYYSHIIQNNIPTTMDVDIVTPNRFDNTKMYDRIIVLGNVNGSRFNIFRCKSAQTIQVLLYGCELYSFLKSEKRISEDNKLYNKRSTLFEEYEDVIEETPINDAFVDELSVIDSEIEHFIDTSVIRMTHSISGIDENKNIQSDISAILRLETGEFAFLSKNYKAYLLDPCTKSATEMKCTELNEGDTIVFTRSNSKTRDIVEYILEQLVQDNKVSNVVNEAYILSKRWKNALVDYMNKSGKTAQEIAEAMIANGVTVQENTIKGWLDEDSHTVGPRQISSIQQIAILAGDDYLFDHAELCFKACASIRRVRRSILNAIAQAVLGCFSESDTDTTIATAAKEHVADLATVAKIERITLVNEQVPVSIINRPLSLKGKMEVNYGEY